MEAHIQEKNRDQKWESILASAMAPESPSDCYDCNICLDNAQDPVVTLCGHLYCWPCIYKWFQSSILEEQQQCPVCKATISKSTLVPLYGRGQASCRAGHNEKDLNIPNRPQACDIHTLISSTSSTATSSTGPSQNTHHRQGYNQSQSQPQSRSPQHRHYYNTNGAAMPTVPSVLHPMIGMLGEMVYTRVFGDTQASLYWYPNSYQDVGGSSPRVRRQEMQAEKSLNRISIFLFCFCVLCLLLF